MLLSRTKTPPVFVDAKSRCDSLFTTTPQRMLATLQTQLQYKLAPKRLTPRPVCVSALPLCSACSWLPALGA
jgi:hypothetical protein